MIVEVALPLPVDQPYSYAVPDAFAPVPAGARVLVPFGSRRLTGVVVSVDVDAPPARLRNVEDVLDDEPSLTDEMLRLTRWIADYYVCGWGEAIRAALPPGTDVESHVTARRIVDALPQGASSEEQSVFAHLSGDSPSPLRTLRRRVPAASLSRLRRMEELGWIVLDSGLRAERVRPKTAWHLRLAPGYRESGALDEVIADLRGPRQEAVLRALAEFEAEGVACPAQSDVQERATAGASTVSSLVSKGIIERLEMQVMRSPDAEEGAERRVERTFHPAQRRALESITAALNAGGYAGFLLHGVTGSGKTEVYIAALKEALSRGRTGIVLVPEIALTPQTVGRFRAHFGDDVAVLHSRMSLGERFDAWRQLRGGRFRVAIGPRSAVLAPMSELGLIIVDEEHESSYKQADPAPRYNARDVAVMRAHLNGAVCILGSATPSLESWVNAVELAKYQLLEMPDRVPVAGHAAAPLPDVRIVDLVNERKRHRLEGVFSKALLDAVELRIERGEQTILLQNRRGFAPVVECRDCGWVPECPDCSVSFTFHKPRGQLKCHYCGRTRRMPLVCEKCGSQDLGRLGTGTQRVEEELQAHLPGARILRMDLDTTTRKRSHHRILSAFRRGEADVLLGTQMVAKGLDFPRVTLVGVVDTDTGLLLPDFRAEERTFQLLTQVAGRAGRADLRGEVILQTRNAENEVLRMAAEHDFRAFVSAVLPDRRAFRWPPYTRLVVVEFSGPDEARVRNVAAGWTDALRDTAGDVFVLDPTPALVSRVKGRYRFRTIIRAARGRTPDVQGALREASKVYGRPPKDYRITIDVDAVDTL